MIFYASHEHTNRLTDTRARVHTHTHIAPESYDLIYHPSSYKNTHTAYNIYIANIQVPGLPNLPGVSNGVVLGKLVQSRPPANYRDFPELGARRAMAQHSITNTMLFMCGCKLLGRSNPK